MVAPLEGPDLGDAAGHEDFSFTMPARLEYRDAARSFLAFVCDRLVEDHEWSPSASHRVISAFVEAFNNAAIHAYDGSEHGSVEIQLSVWPRRLVLRVIDQGAAFRPESVPDPDLDALPEGGMGLFIMKQFMDRVEYRRDGDRNVLTMEKTLTDDTDLEPSDVSANNTDGAAE